MENKLQVRNLRVSFRTTNGKVQAVRDISFELGAGETLAIVGESGSGKSVTSKAILGILAGNAIVESGEILYDGKDLLKISEEEFHKIRGDKIAMIFQDPMSSLNPIVRIGRQLTEAMILKGRMRQRESRSNFNTYLKHFNAAMTEVAGSDREKASRIAENCKKFDKFEFKHIELESACSAAREAANEALDDIDKIAFEFEKRSVGKDAPDRLKDICKEARDSVNEYVVDKERGQRVRELAGALPGEFARAKKGGDLTAVLKILYELRDILKAGIAKKAPDFFRMGYYLTFSGKPLPENMSVEKLDEYLLDYLDREFMGEFTGDAEKALKHSAEITCENRRRAVQELKASREVFSRKELDRKECRETCRRLTAVVKTCIDPLSVTKDSFTYTFAPSIKSQIDSYFHSIGANAKALKAHERDQRKYDRIVKKGKKPGWEVAEAAVTDLELIKENILRIIDRLTDHYEEQLSELKTRDFKAETAGAIDYLKASASGSVAKVTRRIAKHRAIKLMDEVGIAEPHKRYRQYPFEFSGGMRQRIVIAIALAANPDVLICDEPTTALDVTIQAQILELINRLKEERHLAVIFITHDLGVVANMADRVAVMYAGKIVEYGTAEDIFYHSAHPYTWALLSSMPDLDTDERLESIPGTPPNMIYPPKGDAFAPRNRYAMQIDFERQPPMFRISDTHFAATWLLHPDAPKVDPPKAVTDRIARMNQKRGEQAHE